MSEHSQTLHRDAVSAWTWLVDRGGLEVTGRDLPLVSTLKNRLAPDAPDIKSALARVNVPAFLNSFFGVLSPFVTMMRDLLAYFEKANATFGPEEWALVLGKDADALKVDLDHFRRLIEKIDKSTSRSRIVPILDYAGLWQIRKHFQIMGETSTTTVERTYLPSPKNKTAAFVSWLNDYEGGIYSPLPSEITQIASEDTAVGDYAILMMEIYTAICALAKNREELESLGTFSRHMDGGDDLWSTRTLWWIESDFFIRTAVFSLAAWKAAAPKDKAAVLELVKKQFAGLPRRRARYQVNLDDIEEILSLPIWKHRYELYSAWLLTLILKALSGHSIKLHHDHGTIAFAFRETIMATIMSKLPSVEIYAERRISANAVRLVGHGRVAGIQPDYSLWSGDICSLAVECKHYKYSSTGNFAGALTDYTSVLDRARVILANYGPVSTAVEQAIPASLRPRCSILGYVQPEEVSQCERFQKIVREVIGEPNFVDRVVDKVIGAPELLVIDVSGSMHKGLSTAAGEDVIRGLIQKYAVAQIAAVDDRILAEGPSDNLGQILESRGSGSTNLATPIVDLKQRWNSMLILTDDDGQKTLTGRVQEIERVRLGNLDTFLIQLL